MCPASHVTNMRRAAIVKAPLVSQFPRLDHVVVKAHPWTISLARLGLILGQGALVRPKVGVVIIIPPVEEEDVAAQDAERQHRVLAIFSAAFWLLLLDGITVVLIIDAGPLLPRAVDLAVFGTACWIRLVPHVRYNITVAQIICGDPLANNVACIIHGFEITAFSMTTSSRIRMQMSA